MQFPSDLLIFAFPSVPGRRSEYEKDIPEIYNILKKGSDAAREVAAQTLSEVKNAMKIDYFQRELTFLHHFHHKLLSPDTFPNQTSRIWS